jgi:hypothetical protein
MVQQDRPAKQDMMSAIKKLSPRQLTGRKIRSDLRWYCAWTKHEYATQASSDKPDLAFIGAKMRHRLLLEQS